VNKRLRIGCNDESIEDFIYFVLVYKQTKVAKMLLAKLHKNGMWTQGACTYSIGNFMLWWKS
jgi:hypothetical protein